MQGLHSQTARVGMKLPTSAGRGATFSTIAADGVIWYEKNRKSLATFSGMVDLAVAKFGKRYAEFISAEEFEDWLSDLADEHEWSGSTRNGYRSALITIYREAMKDGKVQNNPAKLICRAMVPLGRVRFLSKEEENRLRAAVVPVAGARPWTGRRPFLSWTWLCKQVCGREKNSL